MFKRFPLFQSHLDLAHSLWQKIVTPGDTVIDATSGNGRDTLFLAHLALSHDTGTVFAFDIQSAALENTQKYLGEHLSKEQLRRIALIHGCHSLFPETLTAGSVKLIVYNLGYLPGGSKIVTTRVETTLASVKAALPLLSPSGVISITCYPGHPQGLEEEGALTTFVAGLDGKEWSCCHHRWLNRRSAPSLLLIQRCG